VPASKAVRGGPARGRPFGVLHRQRARRGAGAARTEIRSWAPHFPVLRGSSGHEGPCERVGRQAHPGLPDQGDRRRYSLPSQRQPHRIRGADQEPHRAGNRAPWPGRSGARPGGTRQARRAGGSGQGRAGPARCRAGRPPVAGHRSGRRRRCHGHGGDRSPPDQLAVAASHTGPPHPPAGPGRRRRRAAGPVSGPAGRGRGWQAQGPAGRPAEGQAGTRAAGPAGSAGAARGDGALTGRSGRPGAGRYCPRGTGRPGTGRRGWSCTGQPGWSGTGRFG
jgi:hypothetical protein